MFCEYLVDNCYRFFTKIFKDFAILKKNVDINIRGW